MKKLFVILILGLLLISNISFGENYKNGQTIEDKIVFNKKFQIDLPEGKWTLATKYFWYYHGLNITEYVLVKIEDNELMEAISIAETRLGGIVTGQLDPILYEIIFKGEHDGCYDRPEYFLLKFYAKGSSHNCFTVRHYDLMKEINYPDDPLKKGSGFQFNKWVIDNSIIVPKLSLISKHSYFSRHMGSNWYEILYLANPKIFNAPKNNFFSEERSEYHKYNIDNHPQHKKIMQKWISISAERHKDLEENVIAKKSHLLDLSDYYKGKTKSKTKNLKNKTSKNQDMIQQLNDLKKLFDDGVITNEEFTKAKKKILN